MNEEITDEMRREIASQAKEAALQKRDVIEQQEEPLYFKELTDEEKQLIIKENRAKAEANKNKLEKNQIESGNKQPSRDDVLKIRKEMVEDMYTEIKKYKSLSQLQSTSPPKVTLNPEERLLRQLSNKKNIGHKLGSLYD
jgi:ribosomal protein S25